MKRLSASAYKGRPKSSLWSNTKKFLNDLPGYRYKIGIFLYIVDNVCKLTFHQMVNSIGILYIKYTPSEIAIKKNYCTVNVGIEVQSMMISKELKTSSHKAR